MQIIYGPMDDDGEFAEYNVPGTCGDCMWCKPASGLVETWVCENAESTNFESEVEDTDSCVEWM